MIAILLSTVSRGTSTCGAYLSAISAPTLVETMSRVRFARPTSSNDPLIAFNSRKEASLLALDPSPMARTACGSGCI